MRSNSHTITIEEAPWLVWPVLLKFHEYDNWNPVYRFLSGEAKAGGKVQVEMQLDIDTISQFGTPSIKKMFGNAPPPRKQKMKMIIKQMKEPNTLQLENKIFGGLLMHCIHTFELDPMGDDQTRFTSSIQLAGWIPKIMPDAIFYAFYEAMNLAFNVSLKAYVEYENDGNKD